MTERKAQFGAKHSFVGGVDHLDCWGTLDENITSVLATWQKLGKRCVIRLHDVEWVNSSGVRAWCVFMRGFLVGREVSFDDCSPAVMQQVNLVPSFLPTESIRSFVIPYACSSCQTKEDLKVATQQVRGKDLAALPAPLCAKCGTVMECQEEPQGYLSFLQRD